MDNLANFIRISIFYNKSAISEQFIRRFWGNEFQGQKDQWLENNNKWTNFSNKKTLSNYYVDNKRMKHNNTRTN